MVWLRNLVIGSGSSTAPSVTLRKQEITGWKVSHYLQEKAVEQKPICSKTQDTHGSCMIKILLVYHSYWWQKHSCFPGVRLYLFFLNTKKPAWESIDVVNWWFSAILKPKFCSSPTWKRLSENPFYSAMNLKRHTGSTNISNSVQGNNIYIHRWHQERGPPCLKCTVLMRPNSQQSQ